MSPPSPPPLRLLAFLALALLVLFVWIPFGLRVSGTYEEWQVLAMADNGWLRPRLDVLPTRPLGYAPFVLAHSLTPGSFVGMNLVQAGLLVAKAWLAYGLAERLLPGAPVVAFLAGGLAVFLPADRAFFSLRAAPAHASVVLYLVALHLALHARGRKGLLVCFGMVAAEVASLATYDVAAPVVLASVALVARPGHVAEGRDLRLAALWCIAPVGMIAAELWAIGRGGYLASALSAATSPLALDAGDAMSAIAWSIARAYLMLFVGGWKSTVVHVADVPLHLGLTLAASVLVALPVCLALWHATPAVRRVPPRRLVLLGGGGLVAIFAGILPYLPTAWRDSDWRVYVYASLGAVLVDGVILCGLLIALRPARFVLSTMIAPILLGLGVAHALEQHAAYVEQGERQQEILAQIVSAAPAPRPGAVLLLVDRPPHSAAAAWRDCTNLSECLRFALHYIHARRDFTAAICSVGDVGTWNRDREACRFEPRGVRIVYGDRETPTRERKEIFAEYPSLVVFENRAGRVRLLRDLHELGAAEASGYDPARQVDPRAPIPARAATIFSRWPFRRVLREARSVRIDFDRPLPDPGWSIAEGSFTWTDEKIAAIDLRLAPSRDYRIDYRVQRAMSPEIFDGLRLRVNDRPIEVSVERDERARIFSGIIPRDVVALDPWQTRLTFEMPALLSPRDIGLGDDGRSLGVRFDWLQIAPIADR